MDRHARDARYTDNLHMNISNLSSCVMIILIVTVTMMIRLVTSTKTIETATAPIATTAAALMEFQKQMTGE